MVVVYLMSGGDTTRIIALYDSSEEESAGSQLLGYTAAVEVSNIVDQFNITYQPSQV